MEQLIDLNETQPKYATCVSKKIFGVIKHECFVSNVTSIESNSEKINRGTLIEIIPGCNGGSCLFKIRDSSYSDNKIITGIYKCLKDDYIVVTKELWPYLIASKNCDRRINFVENVYSREFDLDILKLGREIRIRGSNTGLSYYEFTVTHNGAVKEIGTGYFIGLQFKSKQIPLPPEIKSLSQNYRFGGTGIVVSADWIMVNLYKELSNENIVGVTNKINKKELCVNRTKEFVNTRECPNEECKTVLVITQTAHTNNERCQKCKKNWCYICLSIHEPGERHGNKLDKKVTKTALECSTQQLSIMDSKKMNNMGAIPKTCSTFYKKNSSLNTDLNNKSNMGAIPKICPTISNTKLNNITLKVAEPMKHIEKVNCNLCAKQFEIGCVFILRECQHSFCKRCLRDYFQKKSQYSTIQCPYNKEFKCQFNFMDAEIKDVGGDLILNKIVENRIKELGCYGHNDFMNKNKDSLNSRIGIVQRKDINPLSTICVKCLKLIAINECTTLQNCKHSFCNDCILIMIKTQTSGSSYAQCTICKKILDDNEVIKIAGSGVLKLFHDNRSEVDQPVALCCCSPRTSNCVITLLCNHQFCKTVLMNLLNSQFNCILRAVCPTCLVQINDDIINSLFDRGELNVATECQKCSNQADIDLAVCRHSFCHKCIRDIIVTQALDFTKMFIDCTICGKPITDLEISQYGSAEILGLFKNKVETAILDSQSVDQLSLNEQPINCISSTNVVQCLKCDEKFMESLTKKCSKCASTICLICAKTVILGQIANNLPHKCLFCQTLLTESQIDDIRNKIITAQPAQIMADDKFSFANSQEKTFECVMCEKPTERDTQIVLSNCKHEICRKCLHKTISTQMIWSPSPKCPICNENIDQIQLDVLEISYTSNHLTNRIQNGNLSSELSEETETCSVCHGKFQQKVILNECGHEFCRQCVQANFEIQKSNGSTPKCPMCRKSIDTNQIKLITEMPPVTRVYKQMTQYPNTQVENYPNGLLKLNTHPFECIICDQLIDSECGIVLANCGDSLCRDCISNVMLQQSANTIAPNCPVCQAPFTDEEIRTHAQAVYDIIMENRLDEYSPAKHRDLGCERGGITGRNSSIEVSNNYKQVAKPSQNYNSHILETTEICCICLKYIQQTYYLEDCDHKFCSHCIKTCAQQCPICRNPDDLVQFTLPKSMPTNSTIDPLEFNPIPHKVLKLNNHPFDCEICYQRIDIECGLILKNCGDLFCRDCVSKVILQQSTNSLTPKCPLCQVQIADEEVRAIDPLTYNIFMENRIMSK